ncbi:MAG TPA: CDP-glycerol glycerophosphotransferase family protein [Anaerolineales bacterium]|nr:CDP-glycerol glycerophosphotransferase family protein [Anaerolineales bacterium]HNM36022.1 CDP-glycerol glycerophosphotransferase family protein [Anaerolineales bacterium]HNO94189.1 CDP-glycerol glycerophosphotransferase family protein [Anaerolineales bacterium]
MENIKIGIPLHGKMSSRTFHSALFRERLGEKGFEPIYFLTSDYLEASPYDPKRYFELKVSAYEAYYEKHALLRNMKSLRRFVIVTETTDLRLREEIESIIFQKDLWKIGGYILYTSILRWVPGMGDFLLGLENLLYKTDAHTEVIRNIPLNCVLTPGMGNYRFEYSGQFSLEAQRLGIPVFSAVTNYDNIVNMGFRGFTPKCIAVWSQQMADELMRLHKMSGKRIEVTGPIQYDRFKQPLPRSREEFLESIGLDPKKKTIFIAGGVNITRYFELFNLFFEQQTNVFSEPCNIILRPYPHVKLLSSPGWKILRKLFLDRGVYISIPDAIDSHEHRSQELKSDLYSEEEHDELNYLLRYSDVMVNYFSTISLEAAICDLPVIHVGYDIYTYGHRFHVTSEFLQRQTHNRRKFRLAASRVAKTEKDLVKYINMYLSDKSLDRDARYEYAISECGELDGHAGRRIVQMIKSRLQRQ